MSECGSVGACCDHVRSIITHLSFGAIFPWSALQTCWVPTCRICSRVQMVLKRRSLTVFCRSSERGGLDVLVCLDLCLVRRSGFRLCYEQHGLMASRYADLQYLLCDRWRRRGQQISELALVISFTKSPFTSCRPNTRCFCCSVFFGILPTFLPHENVLQGVSGLIWPPFRTLHFFLLFLQCCKKGTLRRVRTNLATVFTSHEGNSRSL